MSYHCMRPHHLHACVHSVRCVWLWKDIAFSNNKFEKHFGGCQNLTNSNLGIWSIAQKRYSNLSYASKRDCASIAPHTKLRKEIAQQKYPTLSRASGRDKNSGRGFVFFHFCVPKTKIKKSKFEKFIKNNLKNPIWKNQLI